MKQLLFLLLFPCLALAQYTGNGNQKITLGEQTTADGLIWRGVASDTTLTAKSDTAAYFVLDTVNKKLYFYKASAIPKWNEISGSGGGGGSGTVTSITGGTGLTGGTITTSGTLAADTTFLFTQSDTLSLNLANRFGLKLNIADTTAMLTPYFRDADTSSLNLTSRFTSKLNISDTIAMLTPYFRDADTTTLNLTTRFMEKQNNITLTTTGTSGAATLTGATLNIPQYSGGGGVDSTAIKYVNTYGTQTVNGAKTFTSAVTATRFNPTENTVTGTGMYLPSSNALGLSSNNVQRMHITSGGSIGFGAIPSAGHDYQVSNIGSDEIVLFVINNIKDNPTTNTIARFDFGVYSNNANYIPSNTIVGQTNYIGQANDASYVAGKIDVTVTNAGNVARGAGHSGIMRFYTKPTNDNGASERMIISEIGDVTINNLAGSGSRAVNASSTGVLSASSSILIKENVENINYGLSDVLKLKPVIFNYIDKDKWGEGKELGFIAEDVMDIIPESTGTMNNSDIYFDLQKLIPVLTKAIQEQQGLIKALEQRILILENK